MEYIFKTKFDKGDIVYTFDGSYNNIGIVRLLIIGIEIHKNAKFKKYYVSYLCVLCDKNGLPTGDKMHDQGRKTKLFWENDLYESLDELISEKNINKKIPEMCESFDDYDSIEGDDVLPIKFLNEEPKKELKKFKDNDI